MWQKTEPFALPAELWAQINRSQAEQKKRYEIKKCGRKLNPLLSQLRYRPRYSIQLLYYTRFLKNVKPNFEDIYEKRPDLEK